MPDSSTDVTRYPIEFRGVTKRFPPMLLVAAGVAAAVLAWSLSNGTDVRVSLAPLLLGLLVPVVSLRLASAERRVAAYVAATVAVVLFVVLVDVGGLYLVAVFAAALWLGHVGADWAARRRKWRRRLASSSGTHPSGLDPATHCRMPLLASWLGDLVDCEVLDPSCESVLEAVRSLDGDRRSLVSVFRARTRLDVGGDVHSGLVVQQTDDRHRWQRRGHHLTSRTVRSPEPDSATVGFARTWTAVPARCVVSVADAETAVTTWLADGQRDPSLTWEPAREIAVERPGLLLAQDQPSKAWRAGFARGTLGSPVQLPYGGGGAPT